MTVVVVGAGIAGLACARELADAGVPARVVERASHVGGRLASERLDGRWVDTGAAYLTADDPAFADRLSRWHRAGLVRPWTDGFRGQHGRPTMRWAAPAGLRSLAADLAGGLDVELGTEVTGLPRADAVVLAMPGPQALRVADLPAARQQAWSPVLTAVLTYPHRGWPDFGGAFVNDHPVLATVCDDGDRRGDRAPVLVAHSTPAFAREHARGEPRDRMARAVGEALGIAAAPRVEIRRWPYAQPRTEDGGFAVHEGRVCATEDQHEHDDQGRVYLCGDAYGRPRVQTAWLSGRSVARAILQSTER